jgi:hypothetical protein
MAMIWIYTVVVGFVSAGFVGSLWGMVAGTEPRTAILFERSWVTPVAVLALVFHSPILLLKHGCLRFGQGRLAGLALIAFAGLWCFLQGIFILTQMFGVT